MITFLRNTAFSLGVLDVLKALTRGSFTWQKKILEYGDLIANIISLEHDFHHEKSFWILLFNISQHRGLFASLYFLLFSVLTTLNRSKAVASVESIRYCTNWKQVAQPLSMYRYPRTSMQWREYQWHSDGKCLFTVLCAFLIRSSNLESTLHGK